MGSLSGDGNLTNRFGDKGFIAGSTNSQSVAWDGWLHRGHGHILYADGRVEYHTSAEMNAARTRTEMPVAGDYLITPLKEDRNW